MALAQPAMAKAVMAAYWGNSWLAVQQNFVEHRDVAWYASQANMSTGYFSRCIRQTVGKSPSHIIALYTVQMAKALLDKSTKSIKEISQELGFPEQFTFRKYFKQHTGMSPSDYRKAANNGYFCR